MTPDPEAPRDEPKERPSRLALLLMVLFPFLVLLVFGWLDGWFGR